MRTNMLRKAIDDLLEKAKSRSAMGQYDESVVKKLKKQPGVENPFALATAIKQGTVHRKSFDEQTSEYFVKCHSHVLFGDTEQDLKREKKQPKKADGHVFGGGHEDEAGKPGGEMVKKKVEDLGSEGPEAYKSLDERICDLHKSRYDTKPSSAEEGTISQTEGYGEHPDTLHTKSSRKARMTQKRYSYDKDKQEVEVEHTKHSDTGKEGVRKIIPASAKYEKELKNASMISTIDVILEKGRLRQVNRVKESGAASGVRRPYLSEEQKKRIIEGSAAKVKAYRTEGYMPDKSDSPEVREQDKDPSNKSVEVEIASLIEKSEDKKKEDKIERGPADKGKYIPGSKKYNNPQDSQDPKIRYKSLDDRVCDLVKDMDSQRERQIHDAAMTVRLSREGHSDTNKAAAKMDVNPSDVQRISSRLDRMHAAKSQTLKSVCDTWMKSSPGMTGGRRVEVPGARPATLVKADEDNDDENGDE